MREWSQDGDVENSPRKTLPERPQRSHWKFNTKYTSIQDEQLNGAFNFAYLPTLPVPERYLVLLALPGLPAAPGRHVVLAALLTVARVLRLVTHKQLRPLPTHNIVCSSRTDEENHDSLFGHFNQSMFGVCRRFGS